VSSSTTDPAPSAPAPQPRPGHATGSGVTATPLHVVRGVLMGCAEVVPGISGGTVALVTGVYPRLIGSLDAFVRGAVALLRGRVDEARTRGREVEWALVLPVMVGMVIAVLVAARFIPSLIERYPEESSGLFFGLILASLAVPWLAIRRREARHFAVAAAGAATACVLTVLPRQGDADPALLLVALAAAVAICALALPGVSGSFLLLSLGLYEPTLRAVNDRDMAYVGVFALGAMFGLSVFARGLSWLLAHRHDITMAALLGLLAGSLRAVWPYSGEGRTLQAPPLDSSVLPVLGLALLGVVLVSALLALDVRRNRTALARAETR
jgi:putative membrane protein